MREFKTAGIKENSGRVPLWLKLVFGAFIAWAIVYLFINLA